MAPHTSIHVQYAFSFALFGIEAPADRPEHQFIRVSTWGSSASGNTRDPAHSLTTSTEELGAMDHGKDMLGLWVGFKPAQAEAMRSNDPTDSGITPDDKQALEKLRQIKVPKGSSVDSVAKLKQLPVWTRVGGMRRAVVSGSFNLHSKLPLTPPRSGSIHYTAISFYSMSL